MFLENSLSGERERKTDCIERLQQLLFIDLSAVIRSTLMKTSVGVMGEYNLKEFQPQPTTITTDDECLCSKIGAY